MGKLDNISNVAGKVFLYGALFLSYLILIGFAVFLFAPQTPIKYTDGTMPFAVDTNPVQAGQIVVYTVDYCRYTNGDADITRVLVGQVQINLNKTNSQASRGCHVSKVANTIIPSYTPAGTYHLDITLTYHINPVHDVVVHSRTVNFKVTAAPTDANGNILQTPLVIPNIRNSGGSIQSTQTVDDNGDPSTADSNPKPPATSTTPVVTGTTNNKPPDVTVTTPVGNVQVTVPPVPLACRLTLGVIGCK